MIEFANRKISKVQGEILYGISNCLSVSDISTHRGTSRTTVYGRLKILKRKGFIKKIGGIFELTEKGKYGLHSFMGLTKKLRQHNWGIKIKVLESQRNWDKKRNQIITLPYFLKRVKLKNNHYDLFSFGKIRIKTTSKSVIFYFPNIFSDTVDDAVIQTMDILFDTIPKVENRFNIKLIKNDKLNMEIISQEYAELNSALARVYKQENNELYIVDENNELRFIIDFSHKVPEFETVHPKKSFDDMGAIRPFLLDLAENPTTFSEVREIANKIQSNQMLFSQNINTHIKAIQELGSGVKQLVGLIHQLKDKI